MQTEGDVDGEVDRQAPILWLKICDPDTPLRQCPSNTDVRVLIPLGHRFAGFRERLSGAGVSFREVGYLLEQESIDNLNPEGQLTVTVGQLGAGSPSTGLRARWWVRLPRPLGMDSI